MAIVEIKTKTGATIVVKGTETEVSQITSFLRKLIVGEKEKEPAVKDEDRQELRRKGSTTPELIVEMREEGYFDRPRSLGEILNALQEKGYMVKMTSLSGAMVDLVKKRMLARKKIDKKWKYGK